MRYPPSGPTTFVELLSPLPDEIRDITLRLRAIIRSTVPGADEAVSGGAKMGMALYSVDGVNNVVCGVQPTESMVKLFFHGWENLVAAGYRLEGSGKHARHVKFRSVEELDAAEVEGMVRAAGEVVSSD